MCINEDINKITSTGSHEDMTHLSDVLQSALYKLKDHDEHCFDKYKMEIHEIANGKVITKEMAEDWVNSMKPAAKWTFDETSSVRKQYNINDIDEISFYIVMNMMHSDMFDLVGNGDTNDSVIKHIQATKDWLGDIDVAKDKLYNYKKYVVL